MLSKSKWFVLNEKEVDGISKFGIESPEDPNLFRGIVSDQVMIPFLYDSIKVVKADPDKDEEWCINDIFVCTRLDEEGNKVYDVYKPWCAGGPPVGFYHFGFECLKENMNEYPTHENVSCDEKRL